MSRKKNTLGKRLLTSLRKLARDIERGDLSGYRITRVTRQDDGTFEHKELKLKGGRKGNTFY